MPIAVEMAQLNTRIEKELKHAGDAALKEAGYTPSQAIRALWKKVANSSDNPEAIRKLLSESPTKASPETDLSTNRKLQLLREGETQQKIALEKLGISNESFQPFAHDSYEDLKETFILDRYADEV